MRSLFKTFIHSESGASLVEYAVALIVVTIIGGAGVIAIGQNAGGVTNLACDTTAEALSQASNNSSVTTTLGADCASDSE